MPITNHLFGKMPNGTPVTLFRIENIGGSVVELLDYGCTLHALRVPDRTGKLVDVVLGYDTLDAYRENDGYLGAVVGRYANRIGGAQFSLNGKTYTLAKNNGRNSLHGGFVGFDKHIWDAMADEDRVVFSRCSPDGEEGYPGAVYTKVSYRLTNDNALIITYGADADTDTVLSLTNHAYFNLAGGGSVLAHELTVDADSYTENDADCLPTGRLLSVADTPMDFRSAKPIGRDIDKDHDQLRNGHGYDHNFALDTTGDETYAATLYCPANGIRMTVSTTMPGIQIYTGNELTPRVGKQGAVYGRRQAICMETQQYPDAPNQPLFPCAVLKKGNKYLHRTTFTFASIR
ncbi:MAG: aldose epimerase family protein [Clostridia bacterium]